MPRIATHEHRRKWLIMLWSSIISMIVFTTAGGLLLNLALAPCPQERKNSQGQCEPYGTIMWVLGPVFTTLGGLSFVWLIVVICLRHTTWYSRGVANTTEQVQWVGQNKEVCMINGDRYVLTGDWSKEKEKVLVLEDKHEAL